MRDRSIPTVHGGPMGYVSRSRATELASVAALLMLACGGGDGGGGGDGIATGSVHACALRGGAVSCWGSNSLGQLGDGTTTDRTQAVPVRRLNGALAIAVGRFHTCAIVSDGVECWGGNGNKKLGNAALSETYSATPLRVDGLSAGVQALALGTSHSCALVNGGVRCWGDNTYKQLGAATGTESAAPLQIAGLESGVEAIAAGDTHTCALVSGGVKCWGNGADGVLGDASTAAHTRTTPYDTIAAGGGATALVSSYGTTCALLGAQVVCWGYAGVGMTGTGCSGGFCSSPRNLIAAPAGTTALQIGESSLYLLVNGGVKALGQDSFGELGNGDPQSASAALVDVTGLTSGVRAVNSRLSSSCALLTSGQVRCWGLNDQHQLGDATTTTRTAPVVVRGL